MQPIGLYIHIPFCDGKCPYCDFYSMRGDAAAMDRYTDAVCTSLTHWGARLSAPVDTVYFGGGTPTLLGAARLNRMLAAARAAFAVAPDAEITAEANPASAQELLFRAMRAGGFNRLSMGLQSADADELHFLGRRHTAAQAAEAVHAAQEAGFRNLSLDLMIGLRGQTADSLRRSVDFCASLGVPHISAYLLKVEQGTAFGARADKLALPDDDAQVALYHTVCAALRSHGYAQYEISNFARPGFASRHNLKYWHDAPYLGIGPAAHSFLDGRRFYYPRDIRLFESGAEPVGDGRGGDFAEYAMLALRLTEGLRAADCRARFGHGIPDAMRRAAQPLVRAGLVRMTDEALSLTEDGFLLSNSVIGMLLDDVP